MKKYDFTGETKQFSGRTLKRIVRLSDGKLGGLIESEANLSHSGDCWVAGDAVVYGNARVYGNAQVFGNARVYGNAWVYEHACVYGNAWVFGSEKISDGSLIEGLHFGNLPLKEALESTGLSNYEKLVISAKVF